MLFEWNGVESECEIRPMKRFIRWIPALFGPFEEVRLNGASPDLNPFIVARKPGRFRPVRHGPSTVWPPLHGWRFLMCCRRHCIFRSFRVHRLNPPTHVIKESKAEVSGANGRMSICRSPRAKSRSLRLKQTCALKKAGDAV